jgi:alkylation response protein AidB-like acyl-CoA dehydrogenase
MLPLLHELEHSYLVRCNDVSHALSAWRDVARAFPPHMAQYAQSGMLPSRQLSGVSGDLGMAILWIVQATIVRLFIRDIIAAASGYHSRMATISATDIGALAHSEDRDSPVTIKETADSIVLSGTKKYITGGIAADFLLITARQTGDDGVTKLVFLPRDYLPSGALVDLSLSILRTIPHASLKLNDLELPRDHLVMI